MTRAAVLVLVASALAGCATPTLERDQRVRFLAPPAGADVTLPLLVRWSADPARFRATGFDGSRGGRRGVYAVFVDSAPVRPGRHLDTLAEHDLVCRASPGCPDSTWLADHGVYLTTAPRLVLRGLPRDRGRRAGGGRRRHEVTVVLLDGRGVRIGEGAWTRSFYVRDEAAP
jgi:hypothetical protein